MASASSMSSLPSSDAEVVRKRTAVLYREGRHRKAQFRSWSARTVAPRENCGLRLAVARKAKSEAHLRAVGTPVSQLFRKGRAGQGSNRRKPDHHARTPPR